MRLILRGLGVLWLAAGLGGTGWLIDHEVCPGKAAAVQPVWPSGSNLQRHGDRLSLVVILNPLCPSAQATLIELGGVLAETGSAADVTVIFASPVDAELDWISAGAFRRASVLPGVTIVRDPGGREAARFGAFTSGEVQLFAASGELLFHGGLTPSRDHTGNNEGRRALIALIAGGSVERRSSPVYGCALRGE